MRSARSASAQYAATAGGHASAAAGSAITAGGHATSATASATAADTARSDAQAAATAAAGSATAASGSATSAATYAARAEAAAESAEAGAPAGGWTIPDLATEVHQMLPMSMGYDPDTGGLAHPADSYAVPIESARMLFDITLDTIYGSVGALVEGALADLVGAAPETLDTLAEIAPALGGDPNLAANLTTAIGLRAKTADVNTALETKDNTGYVDQAAQAWGNAIYASMNARPAMFSGVGPPPTSIPGAVVGDHWLDTDSMELFRVTGV